MFKTISFAIALTACAWQVAVAETKASAGFAGQGSANSAASVSQDGSEKLGASNSTQTGLSGDATASADDDGIRNAAKSNAKAMFKSSKTTAKNTAADVKHSGGVLKQQAGQATNSASVHADTDAMTNGQAVVQTGDGVTVDLNAVSDSNAGAEVRPLDAEGSADAAAGETARLSGSTQENISQLTDAGLNTVDNLSDSVEGAVDVSGDISSNIESSTDLQQDVTSDVTSTVNDTAAEARATVDATAEAAVETATEATAEVESETSGAIEEAQNSTESIESDVASNVDVSGSTDLDL